VKSLWLVPFVACSLVAAGGIVVVAHSFSHQPAVFAASLPVQETSPGNPAPASLSGNWQMSWTGEDGQQRQGAMQLTQNGSNLSGKLQGERGAAPLTGTLEGNQISLNAKTRRRQFTFSGTVDGDKMSGTTARGATWTATRQQ
jgi:hypothetical protein